jgi:hypothetical protein
VGVRIEDLEKMMLCDMIFVRCVTTAMTCSINTVPGENCIKIACVLEVRGARARLLVREIQLAMFFVA